MQLFEKTGRNIKLTEVGSRLHSDVSDALTGLNEAVDRATNPDVDIRVSSSGQLVEFDRDQIDLAIRIGDGQYPGLFSEPLLPEIIVPACHPSLLDGDHPLNTPEDLVHHTLIHFNPAFGGINTIWKDWPELRESMNNIFKLVFPSRKVSGELKQFVFTAASLTSGCLHCQSHGSYHLHKGGVPDEKIQAMWTYQSSDLFSEAERAVLDLAFAAGVAPNAVEPENYTELRKHFSDDEIIELLAVIAVGGFLNRWNDTIATVTDQKSIDYANKTLRPVGWDSGKHTGAAEEQRNAHPITLGWTNK